MSSNYPGSLDNFSTSHADNVNETIHASTVNDLADAVNKIESTLGTNPVLSSNFSKVRTVTSAYTVTSTDYQILADATSAGVTVTLPAASTVSGQRILLRKIDSSSHNVNLAPAGTETIDGIAGNIPLAKQYQLVEVFSDGTGWQRVGSLYGNQNIYYVDATYGNDSNPGHFPWEAKKTIGAAIGNYRTVYVQAGVYTETVDIGGKQGLKLTGVGPYTDSFSAGTIVQAPSDTASAMKASTQATSCEISHMGFVGERSGGAGTYTGVVFDATNMTIGCHVHDVEIVGIGTDFTGAKLTVGKGTYGGTGLLVDNAEQAVYNNVSISNCHIGFRIQGTTTLTKIEGANFHFFQCWITVQEDSASVGGDCLWRNWKTQNNFSLTFAIAQLNSNGSNPADGDTVLIRDKTYRFKNTMALANDVKIGANIDATLLSLVKAVNQNGTVGTDYFTGTTAPTGTQAGWMNLVDYGASGGNGFTLGAVDTTHHACTFVLTDTLGSAGNAFTFTVTSANLSDYLGLGTFGRAAWGVELHRPHTMDDIDMMENISLPVGNAVLLAGSGSRIKNFISAPQTQISLTGNHNYFVMCKFQQKITVQSGATGNVFFKPFATGDSRTSTSSASITDNGTSTVITL